MTQIYEHDPSFFFYLFNEGPSWLSLNRMADVSLCNLYRLFCCVRDEGKDRCMDVMDEPCYAQCYDIKIHHCNNNNTSWRREHTQISLGEKGLQ